MIISHGGEGRLPNEGAEGPFWRMKSVPTSQDFGRQESVHGAGAEAFQVESHKLEPQGLEDAGKFGGHLRAERARQLFARDFDANNLAMMTHPDLPETQGMQSVLAPFDRAQGFARDFASVLDAGREASGSGLVP